MKMWSYKLLAMSTAITFYRKYICLQKIYLLAFNSSNSVVTDTELLQISKTITELMDICCWEYTLLPTA